MLLVSITITTPHICSILGVIGANGVGKSTLLKMIAGKLQPDEGTLEIGETVQCMYVDQNREGLDDASLTVYQAITDGADEIDLGKRKVNTTIANTEFCHVLLLYSACCVCYE
jgi:energy-dependent translational throttle protein EttA